MSLELPPSIRTDLDVVLQDLTLASGSNEHRWNEEVMPGLKVVLYGEPAQNVTRTGIVSTIRIPRFPLSPIG